MRVLVDWLAAPFSRFPLTLALSHEGDFAQHPERVRDRSISATFPVALPLWIPALAGMTGVVQRSHEGRGECGLSNFGCSRVGNVSTPNCHAPNACACGSAHFCGYPGWRFEGKGQWDGG